MCYNNFHTHVQHAHARRFPRILAGAKWVSVQTLLCVVYEIIKFIGTFPRNKKVFRSTLCVCNLLFEDRPRPQENRLCGNRTRTALICMWAITGDNCVMGACWLAEQWRKSQIMKMTTNKSVEHISLVVLHEPTLESIHNSTYEWI